MIETIAISDRHDREERGEHEREHEQRAEAAEQRLEQHAGPVVAAARRCCSASKPVRCTGAPATVTPRSARARCLLGVRVVAERLRSGPGVGRRSRTSVRPSSETKARSPVEA